MELGCVPFLVWLCHPLEALQTPSFWVSVEASSLTQHDR